MVPNSLGLFEDVGLGFLRQADDLGVAAAFDVEDARLGPGVLVVADEEAFGVGAERRLAGAGEAEEERGLAGLRVDVRGGVEREHAFEREVVVHRREDGLLHLAGVGGAGDEDHALGHVQGDDGVAVDAVAPRRRAGGMGAWRIVRSGSWSAGWVADGMNIVRAKRLWYACSVITRTVRRWSGSCETTQSWT